MFHNMGTLQYTLFVETSKFNVFASAQEIKMNPKKSILIETCLKEYAL